MRTGPSSVSTVLPLLPLRWLVAARRLVGTGGVAQVVAHFGTQGALDQRLLEGCGRLLHRLRAHRSFNELVKQFRRDLGQHRRVRGCVGFLHLPYWLGHTVSSQTTWYASNTKLLTGSRLSTLSTFQAQGECDTDPICSVTSLCFQQSQYLRLSPLSRAQSQIHWSHNPLPSEFSFQTETRFSRRNGCRLSRRKNRTCSW